MLIALCCNKSSFPTDAVFDGNRREDACWLDVQIAAGNSKIALEMAMKSLSIRLAGTFDAFVS